MTFEAIQAILINRLKLSGLGPDGSRISGVRLGGLLISPRPVTQTRPGLFNSGEMSGRNLTRHIALRGVSTRATPPAKLEKAGIRDRRRCSEWASGTRSVGAVHNQGPKGPSSVCHGRRQMIWGPSRQS